MERSRGDLGDVSKMQFSVTKAHMIETSSRVWINAVFK